MKKILLSLLLLGGLALSNQVNSQAIYFENFGGTAIGTVPTGWTVSSNTDVTAYDRPTDCTADKGLLTPAVGKNAPARFILPAFNYDATNGVVTVSFKVYVLDANLNCSSVKDFPCPTFVGAYLVPSSYSSTNSLPTGANILAQQSYQIVQANGNNTIIFNNPAIANGTSVRVYLDFKTADNSNCSAGGTKFVFDDFEIIKQTCPGDCPPVANTDFFDASEQPFVNANTIRANVFGGFTKWAAQLAVSRPGYNLKSLESGVNSLAVEDGLDTDPNNHDLNQMVFSLVSQPVVEISLCTNGVPPPGVLTFNSDGSFEFTRTNTCVQRVSFTYRITDPTNLQSSVATVYIDFIASIGLPVQFKSFNASRTTSSNVSITWTTASEQNSKGFNVQKNVGGEWKTIAFVFSQAEGGNSSSDLSYSFKDVNNEKGITQYRIQQVDLDGMAKYSDIKAIRGESAASKIVVYPNPSVDGKINVVFEDNSAVRDIQVADMQGRIVKSFKGITNNILVIEKLTSGFYTIKVTNRNTAASSVEKVVVK